MSADDKPLDVQIGGDHYKAMAIQPMEYSMANKLDACQHTIIKYVTRFREKGGIQDLEKAKHCIDLLIHFERQAATVKESLTVHPVHPATFDHIDPADVEISEHPSFEFAPDWANWTGQDADGTWYWFSARPQPFGNGWATDRKHVEITSVRTPNKYWFSTLAARPIN